MSIWVEGGAFITALDRLNLEGQRGVLPTVENMQLAIEAAQFILRNEDRAETLPEIHVCDTARAFIALTDDPENRVRWDNLLEMHSAYGKPTDERWADEDDE